MLVNRLRCWTLIWRNQGSNPGTVRLGGCSIRFNCHIKTWLILFALHCLCLPEETVNLLVPSLVDKSRDIKDPIQRRFVQPVMDSLILEKENFQINQANNKNKCLDFVCVILVLHNVLAHEIMF